MISGASGFVGENLAEYLCSKGYRVNCIVRETSNTGGLRKISPDIRFSVYDGTYESAKRAVIESGADTIFHLASFAKYQHQPSDITGMLHSNVVFGTHLVEAALHHQVRHFVNTSTNWQYYHSREYHPLNLYAASKQAFVDILEYYASTDRIAVANVILFDTYGENDPRGKLPSLIFDPQDNVRIIELSPGEQMIDLTHVSDVVRGLENAATRLATEENSFSTYMISSGNPMALKEAINALARESGARVQLRWGSKAYREREVFHIDIYGEFENLILSGSQ